MDASFGTAGVVSTNAGDFDQLTDATLTADGKIVAVGWAGTTSSFNPFAKRDFEVARYTAAGQPDPTFGGGDGALTTSFGSFPQAHPISQPPFDSFDRADAVAVDDNGKITVAGSSYDPSDDDPTFLAMARYLQRRSRHDLFSRRPRGQR